MFSMEVSNEIALLLLALCVLPIAALIIVAIVIRIRKVVKKQNTHTVEENKDPEQRKMFYDAYGGEDNVVSMDIERNKLSVKLKDITLCNGEKLQELGAAGVLLVGDEVRCSFGDRAPYIYELLK